MPKRKTSYPSGLSGLIREAMDRAGLDQHQIAVKTQVIDPEQAGVAQTTVGRIINQGIRDPSIRTLYLIGQVLSLSLRQQIEALGFDVDAKHAPDYSRKAVLDRILSAAGDTDFARIERLLSLSEAGKRSIDVAMGIVEAREKE